MMQETATVVQETMVISQEMQVALVGVFGTLAGTALGWFLNNLSQRGELITYIPSFKESFQYNEMGSMVSSSSIEQTELYSYKITLDLYNSSGQAKIMRNLTIVFSDGKNDLYRSIPKDDETRRRSGPMSFYDEVGPVNIPPKTIIQLSLHHGVWQKNGALDFIWKTKKVYLTYTDEKNKAVKVDIKSEEYAKYFENHKQGGQP